MTDEPPFLSEMDFGGWATHYATRPGYGHFKEEIYPLFVGLLSRLAAGSRVLDIGAGPGNLALEFYKAHPGRDLGFVLLDSSREMLAIASGRLAGRPVTTLVRSFNMDCWDDGIGPVDAIASNNALFHVRPERLDGFYASCFKLLRPGGLLLSQQSFGYSDGESPYGDEPFPRAMRRMLEEAFPGGPAQAPGERERLEREKELARESHAKALAEAKAAGIEIARGQTGYQFLSVESHLGSLRKAGFAAGCIWRKREFAVVCGVSPS